MTRRFSILAAAAMMLALAMNSTTFAQGLLVNEDAAKRVWMPRPGPFPQPRPIPMAEYKIKELAVDARIDKQVAKVQVSQSFVNTGNTTMEVSFVFPLPYDGAIDKLTLMVDGKELEAKLHDAKAARAAYEAIVRQNQDPALLEWIGTGMFRTSVFPVPAGAERKVVLRYTQLCRKSDGLTDFLFPLSTAKYTAKAVETVSFNVNVTSDEPIKNIYSPSHIVDAKRPDDKHATVSYVGKDQVPTSDFRLLYDVGKEKVGASVLAYRPNEKEDGYFLLLASPEIKPADEKPPAKTVLFVLDRSGSMQGKKFEQAKGALKYVLNNLRDNDLFNIVAYDSDVESFKPELERYSDKTRKEALGFVEGLVCGSGTNIDAGLKAALAQLKDENRPSYVIFMTDGLATAGETNEAKIAANAKSGNTVRARVFAFGVGYDLNSRLLDTLVRDNFGQSEYVRPNEDIEERVSKFYTKIGSPAMTNMQISFALDGLKPEEGPAATQLYPKGAQDLFAGQQLVVVGRYRKTGAAKVTVRGKVGAEEKAFDFPATLVEKSSDQTNAFIEKLWAVRRVGEIIDQIDIHGKSDEMVKELVALATKHGILTPYTSFLAEEGVPLADVRLHVRRAAGELEKLREADGRGGVAQRSFKGGLQAADAAKIPPGAADNAARAGGFGLGGVAGKFRNERDEEVTVNTIQNIGNKAFYKRQGQWVDSTVTAEQEKKIVKIKRFSKEYFDLVDKFGQRVTKFMVLEEPLVVELDGQAYSFVDAEK